jgi:hypothetical protein
VTNTLDDQLAAAQADEAKALERKTVLGSELDAAVTAQDYLTAERLKAELPRAELDWALAHAQAEGLAAAAKHLADEQAQRDAAAAEAERLRQARVLLDDAAAAEQQATADFDRHFADIAPGIDAVRATLAAAVAAERQVIAARVAQNEALATLGQPKILLRPYGHNPLADRINGNEHLSVIHRMPFKLG